MKRKTYILIGLAVVLMLSATSCEDFLYQQPRLSQTTELTLSTYEGLQAATLGVYSPLYSSWWYGQNFVVTADLKGGNAKISPLNSGRFRTDYLWNNTPDVTHALWTRAYQAIARANNVINVLEDGFEEVGVDQSDLDQLLGECKFIRGLAYFDLARMFCQPYSAGATQLGLPSQFRWQCIGQSKVLNPQVISVHHPTWIMECTGVGGIVCNGLGIIGNIARLLPVIKIGIGLVVPPVVTI
jgi:hypothetical protein